MQGPLEIRLKASPEQADCLLRLQAVFAAACNIVSPVAQANRCWNRVALHHLTYRELRRRLPQLGSQMACNAVYSVARAYRILLSDPRSPWNIERRPGAALPALCFKENAPVYFDRHTLSLKGGTLSMFSLDGRLRFDLSLAAADARRFARQQLREIVMLNRDDVFFLQFWFDEKPGLPANMDKGGTSEYLIVSPPADMPFTAVTDPANVSEVQ